MKKFLFMGIMALFSANALAVTDHYFLRDGNHVHHLKITKIGEDITVSMDVNFEPNANEEDNKPCSADISGEAKANGEHQIILKKQPVGEALYCTLTVNLTANGAKVEQSEDCKYFASGICHFDSVDKELIRIK